MLCEYERHTFHDAHDRVICKRLSCKWASVDSHIVRNGNLYAIYGGI